jgi:hypothetical protein
MRRGKEGGLPIGGASVCHRESFAGPKDSRGKQIYPGFFYDTGIAAQGGGIPGLLNPGPSPVGGPTAATTQDVDAEAAVVDNNPVGRIGDSYSWVNLTTFSSYGGKLIFYHGVGDPWFSAKDTIDYYQRMTAANGGESKVNDWSRLFLSPGMGHCGGGGATLDTFDMLSASVSWVEKGASSRFRHSYRPGVPWSQPPAGLNPKIDTSAFGTLCTAGVPRAICLNRGVHPTACVPTQPMPNTKGKEACRTPQTSNAASSEPRYHDELLYQCRTLRARTVFQRLALPVSVSISSGIRSG